jgi:hypothetical protein
MNTTEITHKSLIRKFHTLLSKYQVSNEAKAGLLSGYGVDSSTELPVTQLAELCDTVQRLGDGRHDEMDRLRKRLIASIFAWRRSLGTTASMDLVKAIACRAAEVPEGYSLSVRFNSISKSKLQSLYNAFGRKAKDMRNVSALTDEMIDKLTLLN